MSSNRISHIKQLKKITAELKKFTVEDFEKTERIIDLLNDYNKWSLLWNGDDSINSEKISELLGMCIYYAKKNDSTEF